MSISQTKKVSQLVMSREDLFGGLKIWRAS